MMGLDVLGAQSEPPPVEPAPLWPLALVLCVGIGGIGVGSWWLSRRLELAQDRADMGIDRT